MKFLTGGPPSQNSTTPRPIKFPWERPTMLYPPFNSFIFFTFWQTTSVCSFKGINHESHDPLPTSTQNPLTPEYVINSCVNDLTPRLEH
uniref:Uncharacterized protein n=1 Tax=Medicago truncatula TaxID=3880 RepID=I3S9L2_MEDTR|nr:unknown [Medicago truncatula]